MKSAIASRPVRRRATRLMAFLLFPLLLCALPVQAAPPGATIEHQPMTSEGLAAGYPFEAWVVFNISSDPAVPGLALPGGATLRFTFSKDFAPQTDHAPEAVLLYNWPQKAAPVPFSVAFDPGDHRTIILKLDAPFPVDPPERPGLKSIHFRWGPLNPTKPGDYPIKVQLSDAGENSGTVEAIAHITSKPLPNVAAYNQLHQGQNENWQHLKVGQAAPLPIDLLITLPDAARSAVALRPVENGNLEILSDGRPIGKIFQRGVPVVLTPESLGPGFARLGIIRYLVSAGLTPGIAEIDAQLQGGTSYVITVVVEP